MENTLWCTVTRCCIHRIENGLGANGSRRTKLTEQKNSIFWCNIWDGRRSQVLFHNHFEEWKLVNPQLSLPMPCWSESILDVPPPEISIAWLVVADLIGFEEDEMTILEVRKMHNQNWSGKNTELVLESTQNPPPNARSNRSPVSVSRD